MPPPCVRAMKCLIRTNVPFGQSGTLDSPRVLEPQSSAVKQPRRISRMKFVKRRIRVFFACVLHSKYVIVFEDCFFVGSVTLCAAIVHGLSYGRGCFIFKSPGIYECSSSLVQMDDASSTLICSAEKEERHECANFVA